jgi:hypothetical protein
LKDESVDLLSLGSDGIAASAEEDDDDDGSDDGILID